LSTSAELLVISSYTALPLLLVYSYAHENGEGGLYGGTRSTPLGLPKNSVGPQRYCSGLFDVACKT